MRSFLFLALAFVFLVMWTGVTDSYEAGWKDGQNSVSENCIPGGESPAESERAQ